MSDIRTKLLLGTSVGALAMIFVMAAGVDVLNTESGIAAQTGKLNGHVTLMAVNPDGSMSYAQGDNIIIDAGKVAASIQLFDIGNIIAANAGVFECIIMGTGAEAVNGAGAMGIPLATTGQACASTADGASGVTVTAGALDAPASTDIVVVFPALAQTDLIPAQAGSSVTITEVVLENKGGQDLSSVGLTADIAAVEGTIITITYTMTLD